MGNGWVCYMDIYRHLLNVLVFLHTNCCLLFICWQNTHYNFSQVNFVHLLKKSGLCKVTGANLQAAEVDVGVHVARGKRRDRNEFFASRFDPCPTFFCFPPSPFSGDPMELPKVHKTIRDASIKPTKIQSIVFFLRFAHPPPPVPSSSVLVGGF